MTGSYEILTKKKKKSQQNEKEMLPPSQKLHKSIIKWDEWEIRVDIHILPCVK